MHEYVLSCFSCVQLFGILWTVAHQAPLFMGFSRKEYWSGLPFPFPRDLADSGIKCASLMSLALAGGFFTTSTNWKAYMCVYTHTHPGEGKGNPLQYSCLENSMNRGA